MSILDFVSQDELDDLDENRQTAFMQLVNAAQRSLAGKIDALDLENQNDWQKAEDIRYKFMNVVVAAARRYEIEPFHSMIVPKYASYKDMDHKQFHADLDHYITQLILDNSMTARQDSVSILPATKESLRTYVIGLRQCVESGNMSDSKRESLLRKLDEFEAELEKRRLNMVTVARFVYFILAAPGTLWASAEIAHKLTASIMQTVAEAKEAESATKQLPQTTPMKALTAPRPVEIKKPAFGATSAFDDLDDDVPF